MCPDVWNGTATKRTTPTSSSTTHTIMSPSKHCSTSSTHDTPRDPIITLVAGSAGDKALDRRQEIVEAAQDRIARFVFTAEDTDTEPYEAICRDMLSHVTNPNVATSMIIDRVAAITDALDEARAHPERTDVVLVIGKGDERWIKDRNKHMPYEGDDRVVERLLASR